MIKTEQEWKFKSEDGLFERLKSYVQSINLTIVDEGAYRPVSTYYDTDTLALHFEKQMSFRIREQEDKPPVITVKGRTDVEYAEGLFERFEYEDVITETIPDFSVIKDEGVVQLLSHIDKEELGEIFTTDFHRRYIDVKLADNKTILQICHDKGFVEAGDQCDDIDEIEMELRDGDFGQVDFFLTTLRSDSDIILLPIEISKHQRGLNLYEKLSKHNIE